MLKLRLLPVFASVFAFGLQVSGASATLLDWSYTGPGINNGSGTMDATLDTSTDPSDPTAGGYVISSIFGTANGQTITGLSLYAGPDQGVYPPVPPGPDPGVDTQGFSFTVTDGTSYNLYNDVFDNAPQYPPDSHFSCAAVYCLVGPGAAGSDGSSDKVAALDDFTVTFDTARVLPEPSTWAMMLFGFAGLGYAGYRRARKASAA